MKNASSESPVVALTDPDIENTIAYIVDEVQRLGLYPIVVDYVDPGFSLIALLDAFVSSLVPVMMKRSTRLRIGMRKLVIRLRFPGFIITPSEMDSLLKECYQAAVTEVGKRIAIILYLPQVLPTYSAWEFAQGFHDLIRRAQCPWFTITASPVLPICMGDSRALTQDGVKEASLPIPFLTSAARPPKCRMSSSVKEAPLISFLTRFETQPIARRILRIYDLDGRKLIHTDEPFFLSNSVVIYPDHYTIGDGYIVANFASSVQVIAHENLSSELVLQDCSEWKDILACWGDLPKGSFRDFKAAQSDISGLSAFTLRLCDEGQEPQDVLSHFAFIPARSIVRLQTSCDPSKEFLVTT